MGLSPKLRTIAERGIKDYYFFAREILGYDKMSEEPHQELCNHIIRPGKRKKLTLLPRGSFKSSVVTVAGTVWQLLRNPNLSVLIASESQKNANKYVREIKSHYESNEKFRTLYGDWTNEGNTWRDGEIIVSTRKKMKKEPSVWASSLEKQTIVGMHPDCIVLDDVVSRNNTITSEQIEKTLDYYKLLLSILEPKGKLWVNGTRWHFLDLYGWILNPENPEHKNFDILVKSAYKPNGSLLMPNVLTKDFLEEQRQAQGEATFAHQYLNIAMASSEQSFKPEWIRWYDQSPGGLYYFLSLDPAVAVENRSDFTGIIVNGVDYNHHYWIQEVVEAKLSPSEIIDKIFEFDDRYHLSAIGLEKFMLEKVFKINLEQEMLKRGRNIPIKDVSTDNRSSKEHRIRALQPKFEAGMIHLRRDQQNLYQQIVAHPQLRHDDLLDALKTQLWITFPSDLKPQPAPDHKKAELNVLEREIWDKVASLERRRVKSTIEQEF